MAYEVFREGCEEPTILQVVPDLWTPRQLDAIERRYPSPEVQALVAEIRRLNAIAETANDFVRALEPARLTNTPRPMLTALVEGLGTLAIGRRRTASLSRN